MSPTKSLLRSGKRFSRTEFVENKNKEENQNSGHLRLSTLTQLLKACEENSIKLF
jgi:hypothetical protein